MSERKTGVGYVRVSSTVQSEEGLSLEHQRNKITQYFLKNNIKMLNLFEDAGRTGYNISEDKDKRRPGLVFLLDSIRNKKINYIIVTKNDRLGRDQQEKAFIKRQCRKHRVEIIYIDQPGLSGAASTPTEALMDSMMDLLDEFYSMNLGMEVKKIHEDLARKGHYTGGRVPIGYKVHEYVNENNKKEKILVIDEESAPTVRLAYQMYIGGNGMNKIAVHFNTIQALGRKNWSQFKVGLILKNPNYYTRVWNRNESRRVQGTYKPKEEWIYSDVEHETLVSEEDWLLTQDLMGKRNKNPNAGKHWHEKKHDSRYYGKYVLTGMLKCTTCGRTYTANRSTSARSKTVGYYFQCPTNKHAPKGEKCSNNLNMQKLDMAVWQELCHFLTPEQIATEINKSLKEENAKNKVQNEKFNDFTKRITEKEKMVENLLKVVSNIDFSVTANMKALTRYNLKISELEEEIEELQYRLSGLGEPLQENLEFPIDLEIVKKDYLIHPDYINYMDVEVIRAIINTLIDRIEATRIDSKHTKLEIFFKFKHPNIVEIYNFRKNNIPKTKKPLFSDKTAKSKELIISFTHFLSNLFLPFGKGAPSQYCVTTYGIKALYGNTVVIKFFLT